MFAPINLAHIIRMRKVIGIGETILDIIFRDNQPSMAVPGGSVFNGIISLGRVGAEVAFISETGNDRVGTGILDFMKQNNVSTAHMNIFRDGQSPVSLAFLDDNKDAEYLFYRNYPNQRLDVVIPRINEDDIVIFGSFYAINPAVRERVIEILELARERKAIVYYDPNFRSAHKDEAMRLTPSIIENLEYADIVRGSMEDFGNMYNMDDVDKIYKEKIQFYCRNFICTNGKENIAMRTTSITKEYPVNDITPVSTIGAGDNFNAGIIYGLLKYDVGYRELNTLNEATWDKIIRCGQAFASEVCMGYSNSVSIEFAREYAIS